MATPKFFWREFTRDGSDDKDHPADIDFLSRNFIDWFGKWLQDSDNASNVTFNDLVNVFWNGSKLEDPIYEVHTFLVADGSIVSGDAIKQRWFSPRARLLTIVHPPGSSPFSQLKSEWTLCIVGSSRLTSDDAFLQVASWDGATFRYYQRDKIKLNHVDYRVWNYFGNSMDAFGVNEYLGPFNGHVNGACVMKELRPPWIHWFNPGEASDEFINCLSSDTIEVFKNAPYLTQRRGDVLSQLNEGPDILESMIGTGVSAWFTQRRNTDFGKSSKLVQSPFNVQRWVAHLLLTTTINIVAGTRDEGGETFTLPRDHFYDRELLSQSYLSEMLPATNLKVSVKLEDYQAAVEKIGLSILHQIDFDCPGPDQIKLPSTTLGGDPRERDDSLISFKIALRNSEGRAPFNILQASYEDAQGVLKMQKLKKITDDDTVTSEKADGLDAWMGLFSPTALTALMMLDFWNPIYSWKRGILMTYVPKETSRGEKEYDLETRFINNVTNSHYVKSGVIDSPEYEFLQLLKADRETHRRKVDDYFKKVLGYVNNEETKEQALVDYLSLAESRRRIYRPLPLDEFDSSMPYAINIPHTAPFLEMTAEGRIQPMPRRGVEFLREWTSSLSSTDPRVTPQIHPDQHGPVPAASLPRPALLSFPEPAAPRSSGTPKTNNGCPFAKKATVVDFVADAPNDIATEAKLSFMAVSHNGASRQPKPELYPTWEQDVLPLIRSPYWISEEKRAETGSGWIGAMIHWGKWDLGKYEDVSDKHKAISIYRHLRSRSMPVTADPGEYWPEEALEIFRLWVNGGFRRDLSCPPAPKTLILKPQEPRSEYRIRQDIMSLTKEELAEYQSKLEEVLHVGELGSHWQELGLLHADWCLHYQEATFLWHRAYLRYVEELIKFPIPYWNGFASEATKPDSKFAGIPPVFFEDTYIHPKDGTVRPNPLKYALSLNGKSVSKDKPSCFVVRNPILERGDRASCEWKQKIRHFELYHQQITLALSQSTYSAPESIGEPWANIVDFTDENEDSLYGNHRFDFDGLFEQVHDNFHGWAGPDMADNTYTAFDPIFLSYHANMDRIAAIFMESHPTNQYSSNFPLRPFQDNAKRLEYSDSRLWNYTTIGDMAKDTRALGYIYAPPLSPDASTLSPVDGHNHTGPKASGGQAITLPSLEKAAKPKESIAAISAAAKKVPFVVFSDVGCTSSSYRIDVFTAQARSLVADAAENLGYIGHVTRIGMGVGTGAIGRAGTRQCRKPQVSRALSAENVADKLEAENNGERSLKIIVTDLATGEIVPEEKYKMLPGFEPKVVWLAQTV